MSYILDALKRSEQERHQGELTPTAVDTIMYKPRPAKHQWWPYLLILVLLINVGVYIYFQFSSPASPGLSDDRAQRPTAETAQTPQVQQPVQPRQALPATPNPAQVLSEVSSSMQQAANVKALPDHVLQTPTLDRFYSNQAVQSGQGSMRPLGQIDGVGVNSLNSSTPQTQALPEWQNDPQWKNAQNWQSEPQAQGEFNAEGYEVIRPNAAAQPARVPPPPQAVQPAQAVQPVVIPENYELIEPSRGSQATVPPPAQNMSTQHLQADDAYFEGLQHLNDMPGSLQSSIPDIRFNSHIYSDQPSERRVMLNDLYLKEGQSFSGIRIQTIGEFYIELEKQGQHFKIPVLKDWYSPR